MYTQNVISARGHKQQNSLLTPLAEHYSQNGGTAVIAMVC